MTVETFEREMQTSRVILRIAVGTIIRFIKFNNFGTRHLNGPIHLFLSSCCTTRCIFEPLHVFEPRFNTDKYEMDMLNLVCVHIDIHMNCKPRMTVLNSLNISCTKMWLWFLSWQKTQIPLRVSYCKLKPIYHTRGYAFIDYHQ